MCEKENVRERVCVCARVCVKVCVCVLKSVSKRIGEVEM